jgi:predicted protein tyrosine phosphatase
MSNERPHLGELNLAAQGDMRRALFVCSGGMLRSATAAHWAAAVLNWNTRSCGTHLKALPPAHPNLLEWAQDVYCMEEEHREELAKQFPWARKKLRVLNIPDEFYYRDPKLVALLEQRFDLAASKE